MRSKDLMYIVPPPPPSKRQRRNPPSSPISSASSVASSPIYSPPQRILSTRSRHSRPLKLASFNDLSHDLYLLLADFLSTDALSALAQTNAFFYRTLNPILYKQAATSLRKTRALRHAAANGLMRPIDMLLGFGVPIDLVVSTQTGLTRTALCTAAGKGQLDTVRELVRRGAKLGINEVGEDSPLHLAVRKNYVDIIRLLVQELGVDVDIRRDGHTALHYVVAKARPKMLKLLLDLGANPHLRCYGGETALHLVFAAQRWTAPEADKDRYKARLETLDILLKAGLDVNAVDGRLVSPLNKLLSDEYQHLGRFAEIFLAHGAEVESRDMWGATPLFNAAYVCYAKNWMLEDYHQRTIVFKMLNLLLHHGANINARNQYSESILHIAALGTARLVEFLISKGADVNIVDEDGMTPAYAAYLDGFYKEVRVFYELAEGRLDPTLHAEEMRPRFSKRLREREVKKYREEDKARAEATMKEGKKRAEEMGIDLNEDWSQASSWV